MLILLVLLLVSLVLLVLVLVLSLWYCGCAPVIRPASSGSQQWGRCWIDLPVLEVVSGDLEGGRGGRGAYFVVSAAAGALGRHPRHPLRSTT